MSDTCSRFVSEKYADLRKINQESLDEMMGDIQAIREATSSQVEFKKKVNQYLKENSDGFIKNQETALYAASVTKEAVNRVFENKKGIGEGLASLLRQGNFLGENQGKSVEAIQRQIRNRHRNFLDQNISPAQAKMLESREIEPELIRAMENPDADVDPNIRHIADVFRKVRDMEQAEFVKAGINKGYQKNYIANQARLLNPDVMQKVGKEQFVADMMENYDLEASFPFLEKSRIPEYFGNLYDGIIQKKIDMQAVDFSNLKIAPDLIKGKVLRRNLQPRKLVLREGGFGKMWAKYADKSLVSTIIGDLEKSATDIAAYQVLGPNGLSGFDTIKQKTIREMAKRGMDDQAINKIKDGKVSFAENTDNLIRVLDGSADRSVDANLAAIGENMRSLDMMRVLGGSVVSALTDIANAIGSLSAATGQSYIKSFFDIFGELATEYPAAVIQGFSKGSATTSRELADILGIAIETGIGDSLRILGAGDGYVNPLLNKASVAMAKTQGFYNKFNPIAAQARVHRVMATTVYSQHINRQLKNSWQDLNPYYQANFQRAGITEADWEAFRMLGKDVEINGRKASLVSGKYVNQISDEVALRAIEQNKAIKGDSYRIKTADQYRAELETKTGIMFDSFAQDAAPNPGVKERAILTQGQAKGTIPGEIMRSLSMLKSFSLKMLSVQQRIANSNPNGATNYSLMTGQILGLTGAGYAVSALKSVMNNETPEDPTNPKTILNAFLRGGAGGLYADFLLNQGSRGAGGVVSGLIGPTASNIEFAYDLGGKSINSIENLFTGEDKGGLKSKDLMKLKNYIPGNNLWYLNTASKWSIGDAISEEMNPGYKKRLEKRLEDRQGMLWDQGQLVE